MPFSATVYIDEEAGDFVEWSTVYSGLKLWLCTRFSYEVLKATVLCGPSLELRIRISSAEVQKVMGLQLLKVGSREEPGLVPGKCTDHGETAFLKSVLSFSTIFQLGTMDFQRLF